MSNIFAIIGYAAYVLGGIVLLTVGLILLSFLTDFLLTIVKFWFFIPKFCKCKIPIVIENTGKNVGQFIGAFFGGPLNTTHYICKRCKTEHEQ